MIHVFETKYASNQFLHAFVEKFKNIKYKTQNTGQGEQFYQNTWPNFKDDLEEGDEIAFQGIIRNTHTLKKYFDKHNISILTSFDIDIFCSEERGQSTTHATI